MDAESAVIIKDLYKSFKLPHEQHSGIKQAIVNLAKGKKGYEIQHVLEDVSFEINKGEFFGIVGRNGSGKSTLLKLLAGIYSPGKGVVQVNGSLTPFIELGVGFNPELTGRENVYLNGALLGFSRSEMDEMYDEIVAFAELEKFMDQKLKNYSSGMQVRLAFSIAIQAKSDILVLDEVLAVGDEAFQKKCIGVFERYKAKNQTIILVTHDMNIVERFCTRAILIENGKVTLEGKPDVVARRYTTLNDDSYASTKRSEVIENNALKLTFDKDKIQYKTGETLRINVEWQDDGIEDVGVTIMKQSGEYIFGANTHLDEHAIPGSAKKVLFDVDLNLMSGDYYLKAGLFRDNMKTAVEFIDEGPSFVVNNNTRLKWGGMTNLRHSWMSPRKEK